VHKTHSHDFVSQKHISYVFVTLQVIFLSGNQQFVGFEVSTAETMKIAVSLDVAPCGSCKNRLFRGTCCIQRIDVSGERVASIKRLTHFSLAYFFYPDDGGDTFLRNVGSYNIHTASRPWRQLSSINNLTAYLNNNIKWTARQHVLSARKQRYVVTNSVVWVRERTIPTERPPLVGEVSANFCE
jgi:hypothetical protein